MSAVAPTKTTSRGVDEDILAPLLIRLREIATKLDVAAAEDVNSDARRLLQDIEQQVRQLKGDFGRIVQTETNIRSRFDPVERLVGDMLDETTPQAAQIREKLDGIKAEVAKIKDKISSAYNLQSLDEEETQPGAQSPEAVKEGAALITARAREILQEPHMRHLQLSVCRLEERLRGSILCLAAFPDGAVVKKRLLVHWWMGEGFVDSRDEAKQRFKELVREGFIVPERKEHCDEVHRCRVRPWMQHFLTGAASSSAFLELDSRNFCAARRACLRHGKMPSTNFHPDVRAIYNIDQKYVELDQGWFAGKTKLRTLQLGQWKEFDAQDQMDAPMDSHIEVNGAEHLEAMDKCKNLRYISFRGISRIESLNDNIGKLHKLIILDLRACHNLEELGRGISKLHQLQYLDVSGCHLLNGMPKGIAKLTSLQVLKGFVIANSRSKDPCRLQDLAKLKSLRKLGITIGKMAMAMKDEFKKLGEFEALESLAITWAQPLAHSKKEEDDQPSKTEHDQEVEQSSKSPENVTPPKLKKLDLVCFPLGHLTQWTINPKGVKKLYIRGGKLATLGDEDGWEAEVLRLRFLNDLQYDRRRLQRSFGKLKPEKTEIHECPKFIL